MANEAFGSSRTSAERLVAVDIGNSRIKLGLFHTPLAAGLPEPRQWLTLDAWDGPRVEKWLATASEPTPAAAAAAAGVGPLHWRVCSVNRPSESIVLRWLAGRTGDACETMTAERLPLAVDVERPDLVGMDRLASALGANRLRRPGNAAVVIDIGSAITVDLITSAGAFAGGAILPGIAMSARAMHDFTDLLPLVPMSELGVPPAPLGTSTTAAMRSGVFWGAVGAVRELAARLSAGSPATQVYLTGGAASAVASLLVNDAGERAEYVPHLTLGGIALAEPTS